MESNQGIKAWQWVVTAIVVIVLIVLGYYMIKGGNGSSSLNENATTTEETANNNSEVNRVMVSDQYPGNVAYISSVQFANPGFVVIHEDKNGTLGDVIGSTYFDSGINTGKVMLTKNTVEGKTYYAVLYNDDGDKKFNIEKDLPLKGLIDGNIMKSFKATSKILEVKG